MGWGGGGVEGWGWEEPSVSSASSDLERVEPLLADCPNNLFLSSSFPAFLMNPVLLSGFCKYSFQLKRVHLDIGISK